MFAKEAFIEASRKYVCIRIETFENKEAEEKVRALLNGRYANTAFCVFDPQGTQRLTRSGRGPSTAFGTKGRNSTRIDDEDIIRQMQRIAARFRPTADDSEAVLQDFHSFRQALNVASADQRLLVFVDTEKDDDQQIENALKQVFADSEITGKFHLNFADAKVDRNWRRSVKGKTTSPGIFIIRSGTFGQDGVVLNRLSLSSSIDEIKSAMIDANQQFASTETRKKYAQHVQSGKRNGIYFENEISREGTSDGKNSNRRRGRNR